MSDNLTSPAKPKLQVWSCGGGTQSCAIAALIIQGKLPKPDISVIANTGRETKSTWENLHTILAPALAEIGIEIHIAKAEELSYCGTNYFLESGGPLIPAYTTQNGQVSKLSAFCSRWWKQDVIDRWLSNRGHKPRFIQRWFGYGKEEQRRWVACMNSEDFKAGKIRLPLVHDVPMNRHECQMLILKMGWPVPAPKSRCWMCPNQSDSEWTGLPPDEFQLAVQFEKEMQTKDPHAWLHRSCVPLDQVDFSKPEDLFSRPCDSGHCFV